MTNFQKYKIWILSALLITIKYWGGVDFETKFEIYFSLLTSFATICGAYLCTNRNSIAGVVMWVSSEWVPKIYTMTLAWMYSFEMDAGYKFYLTLAFATYCVMLLMLISSRLFLQWTQSIWSGVLPVGLRYWKIHIGIESSLFVMTAGIISAFIPDNAKALSTLVVLAGYFISREYTKYVIRKYIVPLVTSIHSSTI